MDSNEPATSTDQIRIEDLADLTEIGRGAAATVYSCTRPGGSPAALKLFNAVAADDPAADQFRRERRALGHLPRHPSIIALLGEGRAGDGRPFLVLELTDRSLQTMARENGPMPWVHATTMAIAVAGALETAHRAGVVHCDVGPANVHRVDGRWKLADFGASCDETDGVEDTARPFTLDHAAPEAIRGEPGAVGRDVYGLASTLYLALVGEAPFGEVRHQEPDDVARRITTEPAPDLRPAGVPDALCRVIERAMSKDPALRPASAAELAENLASASAQLGEPMVPPLVLAPVTADLTSVPTGLASGPVVEAPTRPARTGGRFAPILVGVAAAALAFGAAVPVITDAIDDGPDSLVLADQPVEVALGAVDGDADGATADPDTAAAGESDAAEGAEEAIDTATDGATAAAGAAGNGGNDGGNGNNADNGGGQPAAAAQPVAANAAAPAGNGGGDGAAGGGAGNNARNGNGGNGNDGGGGTATGTVVRVPTAPLARPGPERRPSREARS